jgi:arginyl-tRNA synthetase
MVQQRIEEELANKIRTTALELFACEKESLENLTLEMPASVGFGDLSSNIAMRLSNSLKISPKEVALTISGELISNIKNDDFLNKYIEKCVIAGPGFINIYFKNEFYADLVKDVLKYNTSFGSSKIGENKKIQIEFVSANPTGPLSIAHARQAAVGDALGNILKYFGYNVTKEYYINDEGNQINILGLSTEARLRELLKKPSEFKEDYYQGDYIYDIAQEIIDKFSDKNKDLKFFSDYAVEFLLKVIRKDLEDFGVKFDVWFSQRKLTKDIIMRTLDLLRGKGYVYDEEGAVWFRSTLFGDDKDRVVIKKDGAFTYLAPDIAYHEDKFKRGFSQVIDIWGPDHHGYQGRLSAAIQALGQKKEQLKVLIIQLATIFRDGKPVSMSTRRAQYISLREVLDEVGRDAARFFFMTRKISSHLDFDLELAKSQTSDNPVFYVQYAHARISSILKNAGSFNLNPKFELLKETEELELMRAIFKYSVVLGLCVKNLDPCNLTSFLQEIASLFHKFYDKHKVLIDDPDLKDARLGLIQAVKIILNNSLSILGISAPENM